MLLINGNQIPDPQEMRVVCLPGEGGGLAREVQAGWAEIPLAQAAGILGACASPLNLTFTDPVTGARQTLPMALVTAQAETAREDADGSRYRLMRLVLREA